MKKTGWLGLLMLCLPGYALCDVVPIGWDFLKAPHYQYGVTQTGEPLHGEQSAFIKSEEIIIEETLLEKLKQRTTETNKRSYLAQTFNAVPFRGKHLHISAYLKVIPENIHGQINKYAQHIKEVLQLDPNDSKFLNVFQQYLTNLSKNFSTGIEVYVHTRKAVYQYGMTRKPVHEKSDWQRFTSEVGVPKTATAITMGFWLEGLGEVYADHFLVVEHGAAESIAAETLSPKSRLEQSANGLHDKLRSWAGMKLKLATNLSFEQSESIDLK